ncbi:MAG: hypothetical protein QM785_09440 [Pyrinomonadaceae bacterium]
MRVIQKFLFTFAMVAGLSIAAFAQKEEKPRPPKPTPPVVTPPVKNPPPKESEKPKPIKPGSAMVIWKNESGENA